MSHAIKPRQRSKQSDKHDAPLREVDQQRRQPRARRDRLSQQAAAAARSGALGGGRAPGAVGGGTLPILAILLVQACDRIFVSPLYIYIYILEGKPQAFGRRS